jgi:hypothetical protein
MRFASSLILKYDNNYLKMNAFDKQHQGVEQVFFVIFSFGFLVDYKGNPIELNQLFLDIFMVF